MGIFLFLNKVNRYSEKFWSFYKSSFKIKSYKFANQGIDSINYNEWLLDPQDIADAYNLHFCFFKSERNLNDEDCKRFIFDSFKKQNSNPLSNLLSFKNTNIDEVNKLIKELDNKSSAGCSQISIKLIKSDSMKLISLLVVFLTKICSQTRFR